ncbi:hypothetical protein Tco_0771304 [Tanacetum coccineum]|uniref:Gag-Pol polyprotein n=1 Tax=Tanacetum coccineum TaxID=301880 RepID=A0ABQ4ZIF1_9ASTR
MEIKDTLSSCSNSEEQQIQKIHDKAKQSCMVSFRQLHSNLKLLSNNNLNGTRTESGFKRAFATLFGQDVETFIGTMFLNLDQLEKQIDKEEFQEIGSIVAFKVLETQFQMFIKSRIYLDDEFVVNERQMQTTKEKVDSSKALNASLVDTRSSETKSKEQDKSSRSGNDAHADDADIKPIYDEELMAEVQTTTKINVFATRQQHTEQPEFNNEGEVDRNAEQCHDTCPLPAKLTDNQTTKLSNQSIESENIFVRQPTAFKSERPRISKPRFTSQVDVNNDLPKPVTTHYLPKERESAFAKLHHMIAPSSSRYSSNDMVHNHYLEEAKKKTQESGRNSRPSVMPSARSQSTANGSKPKPRINNQKSRNWPASKSSCVTTKTVPIAEHSRNSRNFSDSKHFVCSTCQKCVFNANHDSCVTKFLNEVNSHAKASFPIRQKGADYDNPDPAPETTNDDPISRYYSSSQQEHINLPRIFQPTSNSSTLQTLIAEENNDQSKQNLPTFLYTDHPLTQVRGNPSKPVQTRRQLATDPEMCMFALTVSIVEPKNIKEAMADSAWIEAMQDELHQFDRLQMDVKTQFSYGPLKERFMLHNQHGFVDPIIPYKVTAKKAHMDETSYREPGLQMPPIPTSTSGGIQFLGDKLVQAGMSKKQDCTAMFISRAEYVALSHASCANSMQPRDSTPVPSTSILRNQFHQRTAVNEESYALSLDSLRTFKCDNSKYHKTNGNPSSVIIKQHCGNPVKEKLFESLTDHRYQVYQGRLLASFQDDAKYEHVGQDTRSQGGKDDQDKHGKDLKISDIKTKSKDNDKGSRSKITKHEGTSLQRIQRPRPQDLNDKSNLIDLIKECHNELTSGEIVSLKIF